MSACDAGKEEHLGRDGAQLVTSAGRGLITYLDAKIIEESRAADKRQPRNRPY